MTFFLFISFLLNPVSNRLAAAQENQPFPPKIEVSAPSALQSPLQDEGADDELLGSCVGAIENDIMVGHEYSKMVEKAYHVVEDPVINDYIDHIRQNILKGVIVEDPRHPGHGVKKTVPFILKVLESKEVNAFAIPGGYFYIYSGLIIMMESESELAGVMAHEMVHVLARHSTCQMNKAQIAQLGAMLAQILIPGGNVLVNIAVQNGLSNGLDLGFLGYSRYHEAQADRMGLVYMERAGYDPLEIANLFDKMEDRALRAGFDPKGWLISHPKDSSRIKAALEATRDKIPPRTRPYVVNSRGFEEVKCRLRMILAKKNPNQCQPPFLPNPDVP